MKLTPEELLAIFMAGGRNSGERSNAKESKFYGDPAKHIKFEREKKLKKVRKSKGRK
jgi:hypothetical protein